MTSSSERHGRGAERGAGCPRQPQAVAWIQRELPPGEAAEYAQHVRRCADCAAFAEDARSMLAALRETPVEFPPAPPPDLAGRVLQHCTPELDARRHDARRRTRLALLGVAALLLFTVSLHVALQPGAHGIGGPALGAPAAGAPSLAGPVQAAAIEDPAHWLAQYLQADGRFDEAALGGPRANELGQHAFALFALAIASAEGTHDTRDPALRAARWLLDQQADDGSIGAPAGAGFDHALATVALLEAGALTEDGEVLAGADRAVAHIVARQAPDGGWQPRAAGLPGSAPAQTAWTLAALLRARELGRSEPGGASLGSCIARGQTRLARDLGPGRAPVAPASLDLAAVREVALGGSAPRAGAARAAPLGELYAASLAVLAAPALPR